MLYLGIDQGKQGALCVYDTAKKTVRFKNMRAKDEEQIQFDYVRDMILEAIDVRDNARLTIESLAVFRGVTTPNLAFNLGSTQGVMRSVEVTAKEFARDNGQIFDVRWVAPSAWKKKMGLIGKDKNSSKALAREKAEALELELPRIMRHDCAEAFLLAIL